MCKYQRVNTKSIKKAVPKCAYTGEYCTYCIYGNMDTYNKAKAKEKSK